MVSHIKEDKYGLSKRKAKTVDRGVPKVAKEVMTAEVVISLLREVPRSGKDHRTENASGGDQGQDSRISRTIGLERDCQGNPFHFVRFFTALMALS